MHASTCFPLDQVLCPSLEIYIIIWSFAIFCAYSFQTQKSLSIPRGNKVFSSSISLTFLHKRCHPAPPVLPPKIFLHYKYIYLHKFSIFKLFNISNKYTTCYLVSSIKFLNKHIFFYNNFSLRYKDGHPSIYRLDNFWHPHSNKSS